MITVTLTSHLSAIVLNASGQINDRELIFTFVQRYLSIKLFVLQSVVNIPIYKHLS